MSRRHAKLVWAVAVAVVAAAGVFLLGRVTAPTQQTHTTSIKGYIAGLLDGEVQGREEGRALQAGAALPAADRKVARDAFHAGYAAGANDVFAGYDGGWTFGVPWLITLRPGTGKIIYRIRQRTPVEPGFVYFLRSDGRSLCHRPR